MVERKEASAVGMRELGEFVRGRRVLLGLSQEELGKRIGRSQGWVSRLEVGRASLPEPPDLQALAEVLGTSVTTLLRIAGYLPEEEAPGEVEEADTAPSPERIGEEFEAFTRRVERYLRLHRPDIAPEVREEILALLRHARRTVSGSAP